MYADLKAQLPALTEAIKQGAEWGTDLAHRFVSYDIVVHALGAIGFATPIVITAWYLKRMCLYFLRKNDEAKASERFYTGDWMIGLVVVVIIIAVAFVLLALGFAGNLNVIMKDIFIPEIRILELLNNLL